jgi:hypothetical protein
MSLLKSLAGLLGRSERSRDNGEAVPGPAWGVSLRNFK